MELNWKKCNPTDGFDNVSEKAGVYMISTKQQVDGAYEVKYVGQASNIKKRAKGHWSDNEQNRELKKHIARGYTMKFNYAEVSAQTDRDRIELFLFRYFDPIYNECTPPSKIAVACNLPDVRKHK